MNLLYIIIPIVATLIVYFGEIATKYKSITTGYVLITGASTGIGRHAAEFIASKHPNITILAGVRKESDADSIRSVNLPNLKPIIVDVAQHDSCVRAFDEIKNLVTTTGIPFVGLVNNAGISFKMPVEYQEVSEAKRLFDTNFFGMVEMTQMALPLLRESNGRIVMVSSVAGLVARPYTSIYSGSKYAMEGFSDALRREIAHMGISVSVVEPAFVKTEILKTSANSYEASNSKLTDEQRSLYDFFDAKYRERYAKNFNLGDDPIVTSKVIRHALLANAPLTRYVVANAGGLPGFVVGWIVWLFPDRITDMIVAAMQ